MQPSEIAQFQQQLMQWYGDFKREMPWRNTNDPYRIWVSEVMLQQTQVNTVVPYYHRFIERFGDVHALADARLQDVLKLWEGLGYYARARNLHKAAGVITAQHDGQLPREWQAFRRLPGVGDYIAAAVLSIAFNQPYAVVDGNVKRVFSRLFMRKDPVNRASSTKVYAALGENLLYREDPGTFNQAVMELGALVCKPASPACSECPVNRQCRAFMDNQLDKFPRREKRKPVPQYHIAVGVVQYNGKLLITRRKAEGLLGGLWEFPGGKVKKGESAEAACLREIKEEVNLDVGVGDHLARVRHAYTHFKIELDVFLCDYLEGEVRLKGPVDHRWVEAHEIDDYPFPKANHKFIPLLRKRLAAGNPLADRV
jgi:A/G-specific adenine glycosylase